MTNDARPTATGARTVFNGIHAPDMFHVETIALPELAPGEILVKVKSHS
jgi:NADPH:quinone reductase-like Zn-dependent oxidoreductase